ncbi:GLL7 protein, partial [Crotophaga sulcirostris]|nr:GLL7 protein [Crotophaga sulcirostris]NWS78542.1 GLL7 protein [Crotophaga sulcirostris]
MRIFYQLLVVLFVMFQGAAGQHFNARPSNSCAFQNGRCFPGICRRPYYWIGSCDNGFSCCRKYVEG